MAADMGNLEAGEDAKRLEYGVERGTADELGYAIETVADERN